MGIKLDGAMKYFLGLVSAAQETKLLPAHVETATTDSVHPLMEYTDMDDPALTLLRRLGPPRNRGTNRFKFENIDIMTRVSSWRNAVVRTDEPRSTYDRLYAKALEGIKTLLKDSPTKQDANYYFSKLDRLDQIRPFGFVPLDQIEPIWGFARHELGGSSGLPDEMPGPVMTGKAAYFLATSGTKDRKIGFRDMTADERNALPNPYRFADRLYEPTTPNDPSTGAILTGASALHSIFPSCDELLDWALQFATRSKQVDPASWLDEPQMGAADVVNWQEDPRLSLEGRLQPDSRARLLDSVEEAIARHLKVTIPEDTNIGGPAVTANPDGLMGGSFDDLTATIEAQNPELKVLSGEEMAMAIVTADLQRSGFETGAATLESLTPSLADDLETSTDETIVAAEPTGEAPDTQIIKSTAVFTGGAPLMPGFGSAVSAGILALK